MAVKPLEYTDVKLKDGTIQRCFHDPKPLQIAKADFKRRIWINKKRFDTLPHEEQLAVIYHERGHANFPLYRLLSVFMPVVYALGIITLIALFIMSLIFLNNTPLGLSIKIILFLEVILLISTYTFNYWLQELLCDANAVKWIDKKTVIKMIGRFYNGKDKIGFEQKYINHPPWNSVRKKTLKSLD